MTDHCFGCGKVVPEILDQEMEDIYESGKAGLKWAIDENGWIEFFHDPEKDKDNSSLFSYLCPECSENLRSFLNEKKVERRKI